MDPVVDLAEDTVADASFLGVDTVVDPEADLAADTGMESVVDSVCLAADTAVNNLFPAVDTAADPEVDSVDLEEDTAADASSPAVDMAADPEADLAVATMVRMDTLGCTQSWEIFGVVGCNLIC